MDLNQDEPTQSQGLVMIDPPGGWKYGFPLVFDPLPDEKVHEFLIRNNYPVDEAEFAAKYCRYWLGDPCNEV